jgi:hypothetical protein
VFFQSTPPQTNIHFPERNPAWAIPAALALEGLDASLQSGSQYTENLVKDFLSAKFGNIFWTPEYQSVAFNQLYMVRQRSLTKSLAEESYQYLKSVVARDATVSLFPTDFLRDSFRFVDDAAAHAGYFHAPHAARDSIPIVARMIADGSWAGMVRAEYLDYYLQRYKRLEEKYGSASRFDCRR